MHKRNAKRRTWHSYGTPGAGANFLVTHSEFSKLWQENIYNFEGNRMAVVCDFIFYAVDKSSHETTEGM